MRLRSGIRRDPDELGPIRQPVVWLGLLWALWPARTDASVSLKSRAERLLDELATLSLMRGCAPKDAHDAAEIVRNCLISQGRKPDSLVKSLEDTTIEFDGQVLRMTLTQSAGCTPQTVVVEDTSLARLPECTAAEAATAGGMCVSKP